MPSMKFSVRDVSFRAISISLCLSACLYSSPFAAANEIPAQLQNSTSEAVNYYVILSDGTPKLLGTVAAGQMAADKFLVGEVIVVTPQNSDIVLNEFTFDGAPNSVLTVTTPAGPPNVRGPGKTANVAPGPAEPKKKPAVIISKEFKQWLKTDYVNHDPREPNKSTYQDGFQDKFRVEGPMRKGYNIKYMDPSDLTVRGLKGVAPNIIAPLTGSSHNWGLRELGLAMPNDLIILSEQAGTSGQETTAVMFSSEQERKSSSVNVGLGIAPKTGKKSSGGGDKKGPGASGKVGISNSKTKFETSSETLIRKQIVGQGYWLVYAKEDMKLGPQFKSFISNKNNLKTKADFTRFFERYGTHWPVATLFGGYIRYDERIKTKEIGETISKSLSVNASATIPVKAAAVTPSVGFDKSNESTMREKERNGKATFTSKGGNPGASYLNWQMAPPTTADNYVPLKVELRGIHELMWPELMDVTNPAEANRIHALRAKTAGMLAEYTRAIPEDNSDWNPRVYRATYKAITVDKVDDEGNDEEMEFYGEARIITSDGKNKYISGVRHRGGDTPSRRKGYNLLGSDKSNSVSIIRPARAITQNENGRVVTKPKFETTGSFKFKTRYKEYDSTSADEKAHGDITISIKDVEASPNKQVNRTRSYSEDGEGIKVKVSVKRLNYTLENDPFELLALPGLDRLGQGDAIASRVIGKISGGSSSTGGSASGKGLAMVSGLGTCLSATTTGNGANVVSMRCKPGDRKQQWKRRGKNIVHSSGKCLNVRKTDQNVTLWACNGDTNKDWVKSGQSFKNPKFNKCLDVTGSSRNNGANVLAYQCTSNTNQKWALKAAPSTGSNSSNRTIASGLGTCLMAVATANNSNVVSARCQPNNPKQLWKIKGKNIVHSSGKCLNVRKTDQNVTLWQCNGDTNKNWVKSGQALKSTKYNKCLDITASDKKDGANVIVWGCTGNKNQSWR